MQKTSIEWADYVWNPTTGCSKVSSGCSRCYAEAIAKRFWGNRPFRDVRCHPERLGQPSKVKKSQVVLVDSMSDLFHKDIPLEFILRVWMTMAQANHHTFVILTKRPERMNLFINEWLPGAWGLATMILQLIDFPLPNVWLGVSVEDQATADERIPVLLKTPAAKRLVSVEPMLARIDLDRREYLCKTWSEGRLTIGTYLDWVIAGDEAGANARPSPSLDDVRFLRDQCVEAGVPFFLKQLGGVKMPTLDGRTWDQRTECK